LDLLGISEKEIVGRTISDIDIPIIQEIKHLKSGEGKTVSLNGIHTFKVQRSHFIDRGFPRSFVMIEELTAEILAAEKKAYGKVIRMMAHEVNNTIGPVNSILQSALQTSDLWEEKNQNLQQALQVAVERNQNLNIFMRNFADVVRLPEPNKKEVDLHSVINNVTTLMSLTAGKKKIQFIYHFHDEPIFITADEQQLEQAFINIVKNSMEAIDEKGSVEFITTLHPKRLMITDTGKGIAKEHSDHLFSPFFSTKKDGQGVGLTLVKEILLNHGFEFSLKTTGAGTTIFDIQFAE
jgi:nitrogen fixation/metabolism regulation signal transduction histidine kinase